MFGKKKTEKKSTSKKVEVNSRPSTLSRKRSSETLSSKKMISENEEFLYILLESGGNRHLESGRINQF